MPELPEVETVMRALAARLAGRRFTGIIQRRPDLRIPLPERLPDRLEGRSLTGFARRAKFIQAFLDDGNALLLHLGMSGRLLLDAPPAGRHEHLTFTFDDGTVLRFVDPRRFGLLDLLPAADLPRHRFLATLGLEPLGGGLTGRRLHALLAGRQVAVKTAIMDQKLLVGVGNIYASEALFRAGIAPRRLACDIGPRRALRLAAAIPAVLQEAIDGGGSSLRDYVQTNGELGNFQSNFRVYDREDVPCVTCARPIRRIVQGGRATYFCQGCQR